MEYWVESLGQNPKGLGPIMVAVVGIVILIVLWAVSRLFTGRKDLDKERLALDTELYKLEKFASMKKKEQMGDKESRAESFWPKQDQGPVTAAGEAGAADQSVPAPESQPDAQLAKGAVSPTGGQAEEEDDDEFADIRRENLVRDWSEND